MTWFYVVVAILWAIATPIAATRLARLHRQGALPRNLLISQFCLWLACGLLIANGLIRRFYEFPGFVLSVLSSAVIIVGLWATFRKPTG